MDEFLITLRIFTYLVFLDALKIHFPKHFPLPFETCTSNSCNQNWGINYPVMFRAG